MIRILRLLALLTLAPLFSCRSHGPETSWVAVEEGKLTQAQAEQAKRALEARDLLASSLLAELMAALEKGGTAAAIPVCKERAPRIAREAGARTGVRIGRTSFRLRNPENAPPGWAGKLVEERVSTIVHVASADGRLGVLIPIIAGAPCLRCHGEEGQLAEEVKAVLLREYPRDSATGFRAGDLRGWFWVEAPPGPR